MNSISKNSVITFLSQISIFVFGLIISIILARALGPTGKGIYALILLIQALMLQLGSLGIGTANVYFTGSKKYKIKDITSNSLISALSLGAILILIIWLVSHLDIFQNFLTSNQIDPFYLWLAVLAIPFFLIFSFLTNIFLGREEITKYNKINIFRIILQLLALTIFLLILKQGILGAVLSYVLAIVITSLFIVFLIKKITDIRFILNKNLFKDSVKYGLKAHLGNLAQFLNYRLDMFLVAIFLVPAAVGYYSIAVAIAEQLWMLPAAVATVLFPRISSLKPIEANNLTPKASRHSFFIMFFLALILAGLAYHLIKILYGEAFLPSITPLLILLPGIVILGVAKVLSSDLAGRGKPEIGTIAAFASLVVNIPLNILLIPKWGIAGAAFASSVAYILATLVIIIAFVKISKTSWIDVIFIKKSDFKLYKNFLISLKNKLFNISRK